MDFKCIYYLYIPFTTQWLLKDPMMQSIEKLVSDNYDATPKEHILCILMAGNCDARQLFCSPPISAAAASTRRLIFVACANA
jgi:hypothetical protein